MTSNGYKWVQIKLRFKWVLQIIMIFYCFYNLFVLFLPQILLSVPSRRLLRSESVRKCSTHQSFTFPKFTSFKLGTLGLAQKHIFNIIEEIVFINCTFLLFSKTISSIMFQICFRVNHSQDWVFKISKIIQNFD